MRKRACLASLLAAALAAPAVPASGEGAARKNLLLISIDTLRPDHLGAYGYARATSPRLDGYFRKGVLYTNAVSVSNHTRPAHMTLLSGVYPTVHGLTGRQPPEPAPSPSLPRLPELLRAHGYKTAAFVGGGNVSSEYGFDKGFDVFRDGKKAGVNGNIRDFSDEAVLAWLHENGDSPYFLFIHTYIPHSPYLPPKDFNLFLGPDQDRFSDVRTDMLTDAVPDYKPVYEKFWSSIPRTPEGADLARALYDGDIRYADDAIGRLLEKLEQMNLLSRTVVVLVSDHGEEFLEHGGYEHGSGLYEELIRIPLFIGVPDPVPAGQRVAVPVSLIDVPPTILALLGLDVPDWYQGQPLPPFSAVPPRPLTFSESWEPGAGWTLCARRSDRKLIEGLRGKRELYDLQKDPEEKQDVAADPGERAVREALGAAITERRRMDRRLKRRFRAPAPRGGEPRPEQIESLRDLGYIR